MALLEIDSVIKDFDEFRILRDVYLKCETGDITGLLGRNGSGKSTLLQIIFGTIDAEKFIRIDGRTSESPFKSNDLIAYLPQHDFLPDNLRLKKAVALYLNPGKQTNFWNDSLLSNVKNNCAAQLSGGERRYFEIKLLLYSNAPFLLLDEPFNGISPVLIEDIKQLIRDNAHTKGIIITDHDYKQILDLSNKCHVLVNGCLKSIKDKTDLVKWGYLSDKNL